MRKDHRPYLVKRWQRRITAWYTERYLRPQFLSIGKTPMTVKPWYINVFGNSVVVGDYPTILAEVHNQVHLVSWAQEDFKDLSDILNPENGKNASPDDPAHWEGKGRIEIGHYALICPGVRIQAATRISIGNGVMMAQRAYITDSDWHGIYDRCMPVGQTRPVVIGDNVWIGDNALVCKGVTIGDNSIVGAGAVVSRDIPPNCIAAGNPAQVVKELDPDTPVSGREVMFTHFDSTWDTLESADRDIHGKNTFRGWFRYLLAPKWGD